MGRYYILCDGKVTEEPDHEKWERWHRSTYPKVREVASTTASGGTVRTVFLAINMSLAKDEDPLLFETRVQGGWLDDQWQRYSSLEEARAGHDSWVARVSEAEKDKPPSPGWPTW
ncbi:MAG: hypothetical protein GY842_17105 [bacterium]|nr:hypothetical protein [bacterium]